MPTGYTSDIYSGENTEATDFIMKCARAFGGFAHMRDKPMDAPFEERKPDEFELKYYNSEMERLARYESMTLEEAQKELDEAHERSVASYHKSKKEKEELKARYEAVLEKVEAWKPPTDEHVALKNYAIEQLTGSIKFDCSVDYMVEPVKEDAETWLKDIIEHTRKSAQRHQERYNESVQGAKKMNQWVRDLEESLR